jgi:hypothetical protein
MKWTGGSKDQLKKGKRRNFGGGSRAENYTALFGRNSKNEMFFNAESTKEVSSSSSAAAGKDPAFSSTIDSGGGGAYTSSSSSGMRPNQAPVPSRKRTILSDSHLASLSQWSEAAGLTIRGDEPLSSRKPITTSSSSVASFTRQSSVRAQQSSILNQNRMGTSMSLTAESQTPYQSEILPTPGEHSPGSFAPGVLGGLKQSTKNNLQFVVRGSGIVSTDSVRMVGHNTHQFAPRKDFEAKPSFSTLSSRWNQDLRASTMTAAQPETEPTSLQAAPNQVIQATSPVPQNSKKKVAQSTFAKESSPTKVEDHTLRVQLSPGKDAFFVRFPPSLETIRKPKNTSNVSLFENDQVLFWNEGKEVEFLNV